jgi:hypothetical protein
MKAIFNQYFGIGDILFIEPIMRRYFQNGYDVVLPVLEKYYDCRVHFPYIEFVKQNELNIDYERQDVVKTADSIIYPVRWSMEYFSSPLNDTMRNKYRMFEMDLEDWRRLKWLRFRDKEQQLCDLLKLPERFNLINSNWHSFINGYKPIEVNTRIPNVEMRFIDGFTLLDWAGIIEKAETIHTVNTSLLYMLETLNVTDQLHLYTRNNGRDFQQTEYLRSKKYKLH